MDKKSEISTVPLPIVDVTSFPVDPPPIKELLSRARHKNAAGKKLCATCKNKTPGKGVWECRMCHNLSCPWAHLPDECAFFTPKPTVVRNLDPKAKGLPVPQGVVVIYYGRLDGYERNFLKIKNHKGIITAAVRIKENPNIVEISFSFWPPTIKVVLKNGETVKKAVPWCKARARDAALERLTDSPLTVPYLYEPLAMARQAVKAVASHDWKRLAEFGVFLPGDYSVDDLLCRYVPSWTRDLFPPEKQMRRLSPEKIKEGREAVKRAVKTYELVEKKAEHYPLKEVSKAIIKKIFELGFVPRGGMTAIEIIAKMEADIARIENRGE